MSDFFRNSVSDFAVNPQHQSRPDEVSPGYPQAYRSTPSDIDWQRLICPHCFYTAEASTFAHPSYSGYVHGQVHPVLSVPCSPYGHDHGSTTSHSHAGDAARACQGICPQIAFGRSPCKCRQISRGLQNIVASPGVSSHEVNAHQLHGTPTELAPVNVPDPTTWNQISPYEIVSRNPTTYQSPYASTSMVWSDRADMNTTDQLLWQTTTTPGVDDGDWTTNIGPLGTSYSGMISCPFLVHG